MDKPRDETNVGAARADAQGAINETAEAIKDNARDTAEDAKIKGADQIAGVTRAVHSAADQLGRELPQAAGFIHSAANKLDDASASLREKNLEELVATFNDFTRRQPAAAFAGAVLAGFALSRFLKSSAQHSEIRH